MSRKRGFDTLYVEGKEYGFYNIEKYAESVVADISKLPVSLRILLENLLRNGSSPSVSEEDMRAAANWKPDSPADTAISFHPARVVMQDLTGAPAIADLAGMREALHEKGEDPTLINPKIPVDLVIDHSVMVDYYGDADSFEKNVEVEFARNHERYRFFKWAQNTFGDFQVIPPEMGIIHQVNLEYLAKTVWQADTDQGIVLYPDTCVGTDSHTTMINGLSVLGWGVGGIEAESAMLGQPVTMLLPEVVGFRLEGKLPAGTTATDLVLTVVKMLREKGVVGKFVEFYGPALNDLSLADRATISNMAPEYGATCGMFPIDDELLEYLRLSGRTAEQVAVVAAYAKAQGLWRDDRNPPSFSDTLNLNLSALVPSLAGPYRPQDLVAVSEVPANFIDSLENHYNVAEENIGVSVPIEGIDHKLQHGDVAIAAITSCTNTSNPDVLVTAALLAKKAVEKGLGTKPWVKTSFAPGSRVVNAYLDAAGLTEYLDALGFNLVGYGCTTCIGNSGPLPEAMVKAIHEGDVVAVNVLSGNRNFEGRINPDSKASYLASPPLVVAYALTGSILSDFEKDPIGYDRKGEAVYLRDIWPAAREVSEIVSALIKPQLFTSVYKDSLKGLDQWQALEAPEGVLYDWQEESTYIKCPPFFSTYDSQADLSDIIEAKALAILPDSTTTDHISPAGTIPVDSPAGRYLTRCGVAPEEFNSYGSRRANHEVMVRGTFANIRIKNLMLAGTEGGYTLSPEGKEVSIYDASAAWSQKGTPLLILAGKEYGTGSSRDWAGKGPMMQGVKAVIASSYERIHRSNLIGMGVLPLEFKTGESIEEMGFDGSESFDIRGIAGLTPGSELELLVRTESGGWSIPVTCRIDTDLEYAYWKHGGILNYVLKNISH